MLKFKHIRINETFTRSVGIYIKVSKTKAVPLNSHIHETVSFKKEADVSMVKNMNFSTYEGAGSKVTGASKDRFLQGVKNRIVVFEAEENLV